MSLSRRTVKRGVESTLIKSGECMRENDAGTSSGSSIVHGVVADDDNDYRSSAR